MGKLQSKCHIFDQWWTAILMAALALAALPAIADAPAPDPAVSRYEVRFLERMIDHHAMAVEMASICETKATHGELRALCTQIREGQSEEIATFQTWLQDWYGAKHEPSMPPGHTEQMEKLAGLNGAEFEIEFMDSMVKHHRTAVRRSAQCQERAYHGALRGMCEMMIEAQLLEIQLMEQWLCRWYQRCREH
jgi:uncharacterized protein (DUF305 family)